MGRAQELAARVPLPTRRWFALAALAAASFAVSAWLAAPLVAALVVLLALDGRRARTTGLVDATVELPPLASLGHELVCRVAIARSAAQGPATAAGTVALELDAALASDAGTAVLPFRVAAGRLEELDLALAAGRRGEWRVRAVHLVGRGPLGLADARERRPLAASTRVVPGLRAALRVELLHRLGRRDDAGRHATRRRDQAGEFESLREYQRGDDPRRIDWKASARRPATVVRVMTAERRQDLVLVVDLGRTMREPFAGVERLDHALAAALGLAASAGGFGDRVGLLAFGGRVERFLPPAVRSLGALARELSRLDTQPEEPDYRGALLELARRLPRRALVVLLSDAVDAEVSEPLIAGLALLRRRHVPLFVALRPPALAAALAEPVADHDAALRRAAVLELARARTLALDHLRRRGVEVVDTPAADAAVAAVGAYLALKRRGAL